jgi:hypothetical protein
LLSVQPARFRHEDVYFEHCFQVNQVKAAALLDCIAHRVNIEVEGASQKVGQGLRVSEGEIGDDVGVERGSHHAVDCAGQRAPYHVARADLLQRVDDKKRNGNLLIRH